MDDQELFLIQTKKLNDIRRLDKDGNEYWLASELMSTLGYAKWDNFKNVVSKAMTSCETSGNNVNDHFLEVGKMVPIGSGAQKNVTDYYLTRYACYLVAQNGNPSKKSIALAQTYFAQQTRKQEILEQNLGEMDRLIARQKLAETEKDFARELFDRNVDKQGMAEIRSRGDYELFGGNSTKEMKKKLGISKNKPLADHLPIVTIKAKDLATEMTTHNTKQKNLVGTNPIKFEHIDSNRAVRKALTEQKIYPETLPPEPDIKKIERRYKQDQKKLTKSTNEKPYKADGSFDEAMDKIANVSPNK